MGKLPDGASGLVFMRGNGIDFRRDFSWRVLLYMYINRDFLWCLFLALFVTCRR